MKTNIRGILENFFHLSKPVMTQPWEVNRLGAPEAFDLRYTKPDLERLIQDLEGTANEASDRLQGLIDTLGAYCKNCQVCASSGRLGVNTCPACAWARDALQTATASKVKAPDTKPQGSLASLRRPLFIHDHQVYISWHSPTSPEWLERFRKHGVRTIERDQTICVHVDDASKAVEVDCQYAVELVFPLKTGTS